MRTETLRDWAQTDVMRLQVEHIEAIEGTGATAMLSADDVPEAVRGYFDDSGSKCVVEFRYIDGSEQLLTERPHEHILVKVGKESGRIYQIEVLGQRDVCVNRLEISHDLDKAFDNLLKNNKSWRELTNYKVAHDVITRFKKDFFVDEVSNL